MMKSFIASLGLVMSNSASVIDAEPAMNPLEVIKNVVDTFDEFAEGDIERYLTRDAFPDFIIKLVVKGIVTVEDAKLYKFNRFDSYRDDKLHDWDFFGIGNSGFIIVDCFTKI